MGDHYTPCLFCQGERLEELKLVHGSFTRLAIHPFESMDDGRNPAAVRVVPSFGRDVKPVVPLVLFDRRRLRAGTWFPLLPSSVGKVHHHPHHHPLIHRHL
jgi:hypothetical protein